MLASLASLLLLAAMGGAGVAALRRWAGWLEPLEQLAYGAPLGVVAASLALLVLAIVFGLSTALVALVGAAAAVGAVALWPERPPLAAWRSASLARLARLGEHSAASLGRAFRARVGLLPALVLGAFVIRWAFFWGGALTYTAAGLWAGQRYLWADWALHLGDVTSFVYGDNFPPQNTRWAGGPLAYHYLTSITVAAMVKLGMDPARALDLHSFLFSVLMLFALYVFARRLGGDRQAAALATVLFLLGGNLGWVLVVARMDSTHSVWGTLAQHAWDFDAQGAANFRWLNLFFSQLAPQRANLYGLPLALLILTLLYAAVQLGQRRLFLLAGVVAGLLPFANTTSLVALALITPFLFLLFPPRTRRGVIDWAWFFGVWILLAVPQLYLQQGGQRGETKALRWQLGWVAPPDPWPWFWLKNLGWFVPLLALALASRRLVAPPARRFLWAFMPTFVICNLIVFRPWDWDNTKFLLYWFLAVCILVSALLVRAWQDYRAPLVRGLVLGVIATMILSGLLINLQQALGQDRNLLLSTEEIQVAREVRERTPPHAVFATGLQHNHPVTVLAGRRALMGYPGWLFAFGIDYAQRERDLRDIMAYAPDAPALIKRYGIAYVVIGPEEVQELHANEAAYRAHYPAVISTEHYAIFQVAAP